MDTTLLVGLGVSVAFFFFRYAVTAMPKLLAWAGVMLGILVMATNFLPPADRPPLLSVLLAVVGIICLGAAGYVYVNRAAAQAPGSPTATENKPGPITVTGNNNVVSVGQTGGVTAGTYINQVPQPELRLIDQQDVINSNGTHTTTFTVEVASQLTPAFLAIDIVAQGIIGANIMPPAVGGVSTMMLRNVRSSPTDYHAELTSPRGRYFVSVQTQGQTPIKLSYQF